MGMGVGVLAYIPLHIHTDATDAPIPSIPSIFLARLDRAKQVNQEVSQTVYPCPVVQMSNSPCMSATHASTCRLNQIKVIKVKLVAITSFVLYVVDILRG